MIVFDTATLILSIDVKACPPIDPATNRPLAHHKQRVDALVAELSKRKTRILIPTPVLSEFLVRAGPNKIQYLEKFNSSSGFVIGEFGQKEAVELAFLEDEHLKSGKTLDPMTTRAKLKLDRQIISIAKVRGASVIYTGDNDLARIAKRNGIRPIMTWEIPIPAAAAQGILPMMGEDAETAGSW